MGGGLCVHVSGVTGRFGSGLLVGARAAIPCGVRFEVCGAVLSGLWLVVILGATLLVALLEVLQRRAYLMQAEPAVRRNAHEWPFDDGEYMFHTVSHMLVGAALLGLAMFNILMLHASRD